MLIIDLLPALNHTQLLRSRLISVAYVHDQPGFPALEAKFILDVCKSPHLPRVRVIETEALSVFYHQSGIDVEEKILYRVESHVFAGEEFESN